MTAAIDLRTKMTIVTIAIAHGSVIWSASRSIVVIVDTIAALTCSAAIDGSRRLIKGAVIDV
jgi:hypothetical protein